MKKVIVILSVIFLTSCAKYGMVDSTIIWDDGKKISVHSKNDSMITVKKGDQEATVDNRGRPGILEQVLGGILMGRPDKN